MRLIFPTAGPNSILNRLRVGKKQKSRYVGTQNITSGERMLSQSLKDHRLKETTRILHFE